MANAFAKGRPVEPLVVTAQERAYLERQVRRHRVARSLSERCRIILHCADGLQSKVVAAELGVHEHTVGKWRRRFLIDRIDGLLDEARPGRPRTINDDQVAAVIERTHRTTLGRCDTLVDPFDGGRDGLFAHDVSAGGGAPLGCSRIVARPSSYRATRCSSTRACPELDPGCAISSEFTYRRRPARSSSASMRRARYKR